ncbi:DDB1- and CUL4-associated factor 4 [Aplysia californica]|uniref:DDB1- and CUL4-associated factor 4 n=1 Tax=Aplysia californica TaxID=6500 RepID=A0ABM0JZT8_APLCA|nr:DDB1- and CUL4-associated factor 4 [Aplysia californica]
MPRTRRRRRDRPWQNPGQQAEADADTNVWNQGSQTSTRGRNHREWRPRQRTDYRAQGQRANEDADTNVWNQGSQASTRGRNLRERRPRQRSDYSTPVQNTRPSRQQAVASTSSESSRSASDENSTFTAARTVPHIASRPSSSSQGTSSGSRQTTARTESDIPGYYYDEESKNYYKILPDQMSGTSFLTRTKIREQNAEKQRQIDEKAFLENDSPECMFQFRNVIKSRARHLPGILQDVQCGQVPINDLKTYLLRKQCASLLPSVQEAVKAHGSNFVPGSLLEHTECMYPNSKFDTLLCMWTLKSYVPQYAQMMKVQSQVTHPHPDERNKPVQRLSLRVMGKPIHPMFHKISCLCWAPSRGNKCRAVIVTSCPFGKESSVATVVSLDEGPEPPHMPSNTDVHVSLGEKLVWTCAWNGWNQRVSIGTRGNAQVIDVVRRNKWVFNTCGGDPVTQEFSSKLPFELYSGTKKGLIIRHDLRANNRSEPVQKWNQTHSLACIKLQRDPNYFTASDITGRICSWDKRMNRVVLTYEGLFNEYHYRPFFFDETESILTSTGTDSYTNVWDVRTAVLLRRIPPPIQASNEGWPMAVFSSYWGGMPGKGCLIMAVRDRFEFYR